MTRPLTDQRLDEIAARAESVREYIDLPDDADGLAADDVPALIAEIRRLRAQNTAGQAGLRDRIRRAICEAEGFAWDTDMLEPDEYCEQADAVLAVLPAPADRAAVLHDVAGWFEREGRMVQRMFGHQVAARLRRMADEARTPEVQAEALPFRHIDDDGDQLDIGTVMASTYDGEAPVVYVAADQHQGDQVATVYVRPEHVEQVVTGLRAARRKAETLLAVAESGKEA